MEHARFIQNSNLQGLAFFQTISGEDGWVFHT